MKHLTHEIKQLLRSCFVVTVLLLATTGAGLGQTQTPSTRWSDLAGNANAKTDYEENGGEYQIHTELGLAWLAKTVNSDSFAGTKVTLTKDLDLSEHLWTPIGYSGEKAFQETLFDGQGHTIQNIICTGTTDEFGYIAGGLFGYATHGTIQNVKIDNANITAIGKDNIGYAGGLMSFAQGETITNCHVTNSTVTASGTQKFTLFPCAGGMAGKSEGGVFNNCTVSETKINTSHCGGGFVGEINDEYATRASVFSQCSTTGCVITANSDNLSTTTETGAFIGKVVNHNNTSAKNIKAENCFTYGCEVIKSEESKSNATAGLFTGDLEMNITIENCFVQVQ